MGFEDKLLTELKRSVTSEPQLFELPVRRTDRLPRLAVGTAMVASIALALGIALPISRGPDSSAAWAVTENDDGTVTVEIRDIRDADGLERKLEEVGVPSAVHYLPQNKNCSPPGWERRMRGDSTRMSREEAAMEAPAARGAVRVNESEDGAFVFTIDKSKLAADYQVVVFAEHDAPEHGQTADSVASIQPLVLRGDYYEDCRLVDGSMEGWSFQQGAEPGK